MSKTPTVRQAIARERSFNIRRLNAAKAAINNILRHKDDAKTACRILDAEIETIRSELRDDRG